MVYSIYRNIRKNILPNPVSAFRKTNLLSYLSVLGMGAISSISNQSYAAHLHTTGHFGLKAETREGATQGSEEDFKQATTTSFSLYTEARINEKVSFFLDLRLLDQNTSGANYLGNTASSRTSCPTSTQRVKIGDVENNGTATGEEVYTDEAVSQCDNEGFSGDSGYSPYYPVAQKAYLQLATDYCLLQVGRRGRSLGMGIFLDDGNKPFSRNASVFDGISCDVNIQKSQTLGFSIGYDKIAENNPASKDDLDQYFIALNWDDSAKSNDGFSKQISLYLSNISGDSEVDPGSVDYKLFDLYTQFNLGVFVLKAEAVFRTGKSGEKRWESLAGEFNKKQKLDTINFALRTEWIVGESGTKTGVKPYETGTYERSLMFFEYFRVPGDADGYEPNSSERDSEVKAMPLHRNFKPALVLFNHPGSGSKDIAGIYYEDRMVNVNMYTLGYRYESVQSGDFEAKLIMASLLETYSESLDSDEVPVGYYGSDLGTELDLTYKFGLSANTKMTLAAGYLIAGDALQTSDSSPKNTLTLQTSLITTF